MPASSNALDIPNFKFSSTRLAYLAARNITSNPVNPQSATRAERTELLKFSHEVYSEVQLTPAGYNLESNSRSYLRLRKVENLSVLHLGNQKWQYYNYYQDQQRLHQSLFPSSVCC